MSAHTIPKKTSPKIGRRYIACISLNKQLLHKRKDFRQLQDIVFSLLLIPSNYF